MLMMCFVTKAKSIHHNYVTGVAKTIPNGKRIEILFIAEY